MVQEKCSVSNELISWQNSSPVFSPHWKFACGVLVAAGTLAAGEYELVVDESVTKGDCDWGGCASVGRGA